MSLREKVNGHLGHVITIIVLLLSLGASYGALQVQVSDVKQDVQEAKASPMNSPAGAQLQQALFEMRLRLERVEEKQDLMLKILQK